MSYDFINIIILIFLQLSIIDALETQVLNQLGEE